MAPTAVCVLASLLASANSQTTMASTNEPTWCLRTVAQESTGEVWAETWQCRWDTEFHVSAPQASDGTIRAGQDLCLNGASEGAFFETCAAGEPLQKWEFWPTAETLAAPDGADSFSGQIALAAADANIDRPRMCLKSSYTGADGARATTVPCDSVDPVFTTWFYAPPPPANKTLLFMPARHAAGKWACVQTFFDDGYGMVGDCNDEDLVANWWVRDGELIRMAGAPGGVGCLMYDGSNVALGNCSYENSWSLGEDGSLTLTMYSSYGCLTYTTVWGGFIMEDCTGDGTQIFAFLPAAPAADAVQLA